MSSSGTTSGILAFFVVIILIIVRRIYRNITGVRVSRARTIGWTVFYFLFSGFFLVTSFAEGVPFYYVVPDLVTLAAGAFVSHRVAGRHLRFWKNPDGTVVYKGGIVIYLVYVVGLTVRLGIEFVVIGPAAFAFAPVSNLSQTAIVGLVLADILFSFGYGLLVGRNARVYSTYTSIQEGKAVVFELNQ